MRVSVLLLVAAAVLAGCGSPINQSIKNEVFGLNSALVSFSYDVDMADKQLLSARAAIDANQLKISSIPRDSLYQAAIDSLSERYKRAATQLRKLVTTNQQLQQRYYKLHLAFNDFVTAVEQDDIADTDARQQLVSFRQRHKDVLTEYNAQQTKMEESIKLHNRDVDGLQRYTRAVQFNLIDRVR
jgi:hypothetical protein